MATSTVDHPQRSTVLLWGGGFSAGLGCSTGTKTTASNQIPWGSPSRLHLQSQRALVSCRFSLTTVSPRQVPQEHQGLSRWHRLLVVTRWSSAWKPEVIFSVFQTLSTSSWAALVQSCQWNTHTISGISIMRKRDLSGWIFTVWKEIPIFRCSCTDNSLSFCACNCPHFTGISTCPD